MSSWHFKGMELLGEVPLCLLCSVHHSGLESTSSFFIQLGSLYNFYFIDPILEGLRDEPKPRILKSE